MMEKLIERGEAIASERQQSRIREIAKTMAERLPRAEIEMLADGFSVRDALLLHRWLDDADLRFLGASSK